MRRLLRIFDPAVAVIRFWYDGAMVVLTSPAGRLRLVRRILIVTVLETAALWFAALVIPGVSITDRGAAISASLVIGFLGSSIRPALLYVTLPFVVLTFGFLSLFINAGLLLLAAELVSGFDVNGIGWAILAAFVMSGASTALSAVFNIREEESFYRHLFLRSGRRVKTYRGEADRSRGLLIIQIDGLSREVLQFGIRSGLMPTLARWVREGTHSLTGWECGLPSQTSASQAGILHGDNSDIPAFRWFDKELGRVVVSNRPGDAALIESRSSANGAGLLEGGASISNLISGSAQKNTLTMSALMDSESARSSDFASYFLNPFNFTRAVILMLREVAFEWWQARRQSILGVEPRIGRGGSYPFLRAVTCVLLRDITTSAVVDDMSAGVPIIYCDYLGYDEIAHHAGPEREEALAELRNIDRQIAMIEHLEKETPVRYEIVVLSDHGQSQGATFKQRYGKTLTETVGEFSGHGSVVVDSSGTSEDWGHLNAVINQTLGMLGGVSNRLARIIFRNSRDSTTLEVGPDRDKALAEMPDIVVSASGNLAMLHFAKSVGRVTSETIESQQPGLLDKLATHPGVGFIMVRSKARGLLAIGGSGELNLTTGELTGEDPLKFFGERVRERLERLDSFSNVGDIVINSRIDSGTDEVAAFEELVGSHGGVGGLQTSAFLLHPVELTVDGPLRGAEQVHHVLSGWKSDLTSATTGPAR